MTEWTETDSGGRVGDGLSETNIPSDAHHIKGWHRAKAEGVQIYSDGETFWVLHSVTGRVNDVQEESSLEAAVETAKRVRQNA